MDRRCCCWADEGRGETAAHDAGRAALAKTRRGRLDSNRDMARFVGRVSFPGV